MTRTLNKVMLIGNVGTAPLLRYTPGGSPICSFRLATTDIRRDRDNAVKEYTDWHTVVAWRGLAEIISKIVSKGSKVYVEGKLQTRNFNEKNGTKRSVVEIVAENLLLLDSRRQYSKDTDSKAPESDLKEDEITFDSAFDEDNFFDVDFGDDLSGGSSKSDKLF